jgi:catechol 2,3-dioxygenase-like lactoylglutathione lyase family enzyme
MLGTPDHIAYVVRDLDEGVATLGTAFGLEPTRDVALPAFSLRSVFLGAAPDAVEVVEFLDPELADARLGGLDVRLDHVGYVVASIERAAARLRELGVRFCGPDGILVDEPIELAGSRHLWTTPGDASLGFSLQLIERKEQG